MSDTIFRWDSRDFYIEPTSDCKQSFAQWFNDEYLSCKLFITQKAMREGIMPEELSYDVRMLQDRWDLKFIVTARKVPR
jgi:hypothetical protein